jgi:hypothetical protein
MLRWLQCLQQAVEPVRMQAASSDYSAKLLLAWKLACSQHACLLPRCMLSLVLWDLTLTTHLTGALQHRIVLRACAYRCCALGWRYPAVQLILRAATLQGSLVLSCAVWRLIFAESSHA